MYFIKKTSFYVHRRFCACSFQVLQHRQNEIQHLYLNETKWFLWKVIWGSFFFLWKLLLYSVCCYSQCHDLCSQKKVTLQPFKKSFRMMMYYLVWWWKMAIEENVYQCAETMHKFLMAGVFHPVSLDKVLWSNSCLSTKPQAQGRVKEEL